VKADRYLKVLYQGRLAGTLALTPEKKAAFEYADEWLKDGFSISPFSLPLKKQVFIPQKDYFHGLFGVFADSLPDAWGNILLNRLLKKKGINADQMDILDRLAIVGSSGMGALTYQPEIQVAEEQRIRQNQLLCEQLADLELDINEVPDNLLKQIFHNKEAYCRQLEQLKKQDRIKSLIFLSRQSICILGWLFVMILCLYFYFELFTAYMTLPFQLIALSMITVVFVCMIRTIYYNEKA